MDEAALQSSVILKESQVKELFAEYYYDGSLVSAKTTSATERSVGPKPNANSNNTKQPISTAEIEINGV